MSEVATRLVEQKYTEETHLLRSEAIAALNLNLNLESLPPDYTGVHEISEAIYRKVSADINSLDTASWQQETEEFMLLASQHLLIEEGSVVDADPVAVSIITNTNLTQVKSGLYVVTSREYTLTNNKATFDIGFLRIHDGHVLYGSSGYLIIEDDNVASLKFYPPIDSAYNAVDYSLLISNSAEVDKQLDTVSKMRELIAGFTAA